MGEPSITIFEPLCAVFRRKLKSEGLKYTPERAQILDTIIQIDDVFEAERLQEELRQSDFRVSKATIYRTLKLLQEAGLIHPVPLEKEQTSYMLAYGGRPHDLVVRVDTSEIETVEIPELDALCERLCRERGLKLRGRSFQVFAEKE
jgi:Fur family transcriptional regulator, ferric uptake regulator